jgi:hypothetical protein
MPAAVDPPPNSLQANGVASANGHDDRDGDTNAAHRPRTPSLNGFSLALTEYSANPSPPSRTKQANASSIVPEELLLPNGHPDVSTSRPPPHSIVRRTR